MDHISKLSFWLLYFWVISRIFWYPIVKFIISKYNTIISEYNPFYLHPEIQYCWQYNSGRNWLLLCQILDMSNFKWSVSNVKCTIEGWKLDHFGIHLYFLNDSINGCISLNEVKLTVSTNNHSLKGVSEMSKPNHFLWIHF